MQKPLSIKDDTHHYIKIRFCAQKRYHLKSKRTNHGTGTDFLSHITDKGLISNDINKKKSKYNKVNVHKILTE